MYEKYQKFFLYINCSPSFQDGGEMIAQSLSLFCAFSHVPYIPTVTHEYACTRNLAHTTYSAHCNRTLPLLYSWNTSGWKNDSAALKRKRCLSKLPVKQPKETDEDFYHFYSRSSPGDTGSFSWPWPCWHSPRRSQRGGSGGGSRSRKTRMKNRQIPRKLFFCKYSKSKNEFAQAPAIGASIDSSPKVKGSRTGRLFFGVRRDSLL